MSVPVRLVERFPVVPADRLIGQMVVPPRFDHETFDTYLPDPGQPTQAAAVTLLRGFAEQLNAVGAPGAGSRRRLFRRAPPVTGARAGIYLDGGFGVGKTHLLASLWHAAPAPKAFGTFVGYTNLVGALGFHQTVEALSAQRLVCIDEFELDDPGDTVLMSTLLGKLVDRGVKLAATSNTLPDALGEGRFAADDFLREIQGLAAHFTVARVDGEDYRHRGLPPAPTPVTDDLVVATASDTPGASLDDFASLEAHLAKVHPSHYGTMVDDVTAVFLRDVVTITDQSKALRLVVLADRLYDRDIPVVASGVPFDQIFTPEMLRGGYRKKYFRAVSRLVALAREGARLVVEPR